MKEKYFTLIAALIISVNSFCLGGTVKGFVTITTGEKLAGANVYLSSTLIGRSTDSNGYFEIEKIPSGSYKIVVSMIGFMMKEENLIINDDEVIIKNFEMEEITYNLEEIVVHSKVSEEWVRNRDIFCKYFLGLTAYANECIIKNSEILEFKKDSSVLYASVKEPILIVNNALGYRISCDLKTFCYDESKHKSWMDAGYFFEELIPDNNDEKNKWETNREKMYDASINCFLKWLNNAELSTQKYDLLLISRLPSSYVEPTKTFVTSIEQLISRENSSMNYYLVFKNILSIKDNYSGNHSYLKLLQDKVEVDKNGYPLQLKPYEVYGYWGMEGLANQLPKNYTLIKN